MSESIKTTEELPETPTIWIDADACPVAIKDLVFRVSRRLMVKVVLVANKSIVVPKFELITSLLVSSGADVADNTIVAKMSAGDIVITGDIPLADRVVGKNGIAIGPRGELFDESSIKGRLATRDLMEKFRAAGMETKGQKPLVQKDVQAFANQLDRIVTRRLRKRKK